MRAANAEQSIFLAALELQTPAEREAYLKGACGADAAMLSNVQGLLAVHEEGDNFLDRSPLDATTNEPPAARPGTHIGPYKLLEQIGEGGMGLVFVAEQQQPVRRKVALKLIKPGMDTKQVIARFEAERQALAIMDHSNIAKVFDGGATAESRPFFVMELVKGKPITDYCDRNHLGTRQRLELFLDVCQAVQHAHQKGIIHRDLKPSNVLVEVHDVRPVVKIIDFGIAKAIGQQLTDKTMYTGIAQMIGTPLYMSPEQAGLSSLDVDTRSDLYSLGVLLYELLTGSTPFDGEALKKAGFDEMRRIVREDEPPKPSARLSTMHDQLLSTLAEQRGMEPRQLGQQMRGELDCVVMKALEKDRNRRYESASALAADVQRYLQDEPVLACPPSLRYRLGKFLRKHRTSVLMAAVLLVAALVLGAVTGWVALDRAGRQTETDRTVNAALLQAKQLQDDRKIPEALAKAQQAKAILASGTGTPDLELLVEARLADLGMAANLEEIRNLRSIDWHVSDYYHAKADQDYAKAFRDFGMDVLALLPDEAASRIRERTVAVELAAGLDDWSAVVKRIGSTDNSKWKRLLAVARGADPDPLRTRVRDAFEKGAADELQALLNLALARMGEMPPPTLAALGEALGNAGNYDGAVQLLLQAQVYHSGDYGINFGLAHAFSKLKTPNLDEAIRFYTAAIAVRPDTLPALGNLGLALQQKKRLDEAITIDRRAILISDSAKVHYNLGIALMEKNLLDEAIAAYRKAIDIDPKYAPAYCNLGYALLRKNQLDEAIAACRKAIDIDPKDAPAYINLGAALMDKNQLDEAIAAFRKAIDIDPKIASTYLNLGNSLMRKKQLDEAIAAYRKAIDIDPKLAEAYSNLGGALSRKNKWDEAIAAHRKAIDIDPKFAMGYNNLGNALWIKNQPDEAIAAYRKAIDLDPKDAMAHFNLGVALQQQGKFADALAAWKQGHELASETPDGLWSAERVQKAEQFVRLDAKLPSFLSGKTQPADAAERIALAELCQLPCRQFNAAAARLFTDAFAADPKLANDLDIGNRYAAACAAALAGCGQGKDAANLEAKEYARLRGQALAWLTADLAAYRSMLAQAPAKVRQGMQHWQQDSDFNGVRGAAALAKLPEAERQEWRKLWEEVEELRKRAETPQPH